MALQRPPFSSVGPRVGKVKICCRTSGETFSKNHAPPSALTATDDCVRGRTSGEPARTAAQLKQRQFHCGTPPPAAEPRMRICIAQWSVVSVQWLEKKARPVLH